MHSGLYFDHFNVDKFKEQHSNKLVNAFLIASAVAFLGVLYHGPPDLVFQSNNTFLDSNLTPNEIYTIDNNLNSQKLRIYAMRSDSSIIDSLVYEPLSSNDLAGHKLIAVSNQNQLKVYSTENSQMVLGYIPKSDSLMESVASPEILASYGLYLAGLGQSEKKDSHLACRYLESAIENGGRNLGNKLGDLVANKLFHIYVTDKIDSCNPNIVIKSIENYRPSGTIRYKELADVHITNNDMFRAILSFLNFLVNSKKVFC